MTDLEHVVAYLATWEALLRGHDPTGVELTPRPAWHRHALCHGRTELFFPRRGDSTDEARALCSACPVRQECQATGLEDRTLQGIWGGLSQRERRALRRGAA